jgi:ABC-type uncharacterized transport system substrate-binding protein
VKRREFITLLGCTAAAWPLMALGQQPAMPLVGFLHARSPDHVAYQVAAFRHALAQNGYVEGQGVTIEYRFASGRYDQLPAMAAELARRPVAVLTAASDPAALAAKAATSSIPIVFLVGDDPVKLGLVASYNRPGGNATGMNILTAAMESKRLQLLHELVPRAETIGFVLNPNYALAERQLHDVQEAARLIGLRINVLRASHDREMDGVFETVVQQRIPALAVGADPFLDTQRDKMIAFAARHAVPTMYQFREHAAAGGLMSYGIDFTEIYRQVGAYTSRILKGAKPADLPVLQPTKFEFVINMKTARALGVKISANLLSLADEVIE